MAAIGMHTIMTNPPTEAASSQGVVQLAIPQLSSVSNQLQSSLSSSPSTISLTGLHNWHPFVIDDNVRRIFGAGLPDQAFMLRHRPGTKLRDNSTICRKRKVESPTTPLLQSGPVLSAAMVIDSDEEADSFVPFDFVDHEPANNHRVDQGFSYHLQRLISGHEAQPPAQIESTPSQASRSRQQHSTRRVVRDDSDEDGPVISSTSGGLAQCDSGLQHSNQRAESPDWMAQPAKKTYGGQNRHRVSVVRWMLVYLTDLFQYARGLK